MFKNEEIKFECVVGGGIVSYRLIGFDGILKENQYPSKYMACKNYTELKFIEPLVYQQEDGSIKLRDCLIRFGYKHIGTHGHVMGTYGIDWTEDYVLRIGDVVPEVIYNQILNVCDRAWHRLRGITEDIRLLERTRAGVVEKIEFKAQ